jgi:hypothetical protein
MPRIRAASASTPAVAQPHVIDPNAIYTIDAARAALRLTATTIRRELRLGRLKVSKRAGRYYVLGRWLLEWLEAGEVRRASGQAES